MRTRRSLRHVPEQYVRGEVWLVELPRLDARLLADTTLIGHDQSCTIEVLKDQVLHAKDNDA